MANVEVSGHPIQLANGTYIDQGQEGDDRTWTKAIPEWVNVTDLIIHK